MTFNPTEFRFWHKEFPMFSLWATSRGILFMPKEFSEEGTSSQYDLTSKIYLFMKRLSQDYKTILMMDSEERDKLFEMELRMIEEESKDVKSK